MNPELVIWEHLLRWFHALRARLEVVRADPEAGYSTEAVVITALLVAMGVAAAAIIATKVLSTANGISTGSGN